MKKITKNSKVWQYMSHLFLSVDQFGNALAGGNSDNTISARVGYYNHHAYNSSEVPWYWKTLETIIDFTFKPVDGPGHCHEAYHNDAGEIFGGRVTNILIAIAAIIIISSCIVIGAILYFLLALDVLEQRTINRNENLKKRLDYCNFQLKSAREELEEHNIDDHNISEVEKSLSELLMKAKKIQKKISESKLKSKQLGQL